MRSPTLILVELLELRASVEEIKSDTHKVVDLPVRVPDDLRPGRSSLPIARVVVR